MYFKKLRLQMFCALYMKLSLLLATWHLESAHFLTPQPLMPCWVEFILMQFALLLELTETGRLISMAAVCQWLS